MLEYYKPAKRAKLNVSKPLAEEKLSSDDVKSDVPELPFISGPWYHECRSYTRKKMQLSKLLSTKSLGRNTKE